MDCCGRVHGSMYNGGMWSPALASVEAMSPSEKSQLSADWLSRLHAAAPEDPWTYGFSLVHREIGIAARERLRNVRQETRERAIVAIRQRVLDVAGAKWPQHQPLGRDFRRRRHSIARRARRPR